jgi:hypothetical protein
MSDSFGVGKKPRLPKLASEKIDAALMGPILQGHGVHRLLNIRDSLGSPVRAKRRLTFN